MYDLIFLEEKLKEKEDYNLHYLNRYIKFISVYLNKGERVTECIHHILPKGKDCWPEYSNFKYNEWNKLKLTNKEHFIAHLLLSKAFPNINSMTYSFNMMCNFYSERKNSKIYSNQMKNFSNLISQTNKGIKRTEKQKEAMSKITKNKIVVFTIDDPSHNFQIHKDDFIKGFHFYHRTGKKHKDETKKKIGKKGKLTYYNPEDLKMTAAYPDEEPEGWIRGNPRQSKKASEKFLGLMHYMDPITNETKRYKEGEEPEGWIRKRFANKSDNKGFLKTNTDMINVVDFISKTSRKIYRHDINKNVHGPQSATSTEKTNIFVYNDLIFTSMTAFKKISQKHGLYFNDLNNKNMSDYYIKPSHGNCSNEINDFRKNNLNKKLIDFGVEVYKLENFDFDKFKDKEIYWYE